MSNNDLAISIPTDADDTQAEELTSAACLAAGTRPYLWGSNELVFTALSSADDVLTALSERFSENSIYSTTLEDKPTTTVFGQEVPHITIQLAI